MGLFTDLGGGSHHSLLKDVVLERATFARRLGVMVAFVFVLMSVLVYRLSFLQLEEHDRYSLLAENNRVRLAPLPPGRGLIYDRKGILLAENVPSYTLELVPEENKNLAAALRNISKVIHLSDDEIAAFKKLERRTPAFRSIPLKFNLTEEEVAKFYVDQFRFPGTSIEVRQRRHYPQGEIFSHVIGYVGRINEKDQKRLDKVNYRGTNYVGKVGIERYYEELLHGEVGVREEEINSRGRRLRTLSEDPAIAGPNLYLTLDTGLQKAALDALGEETGSVVAVDPRTGEVLAMVSTPTYDSNLFINGISVKDYSVLRDDPERPLFNRATNGQYPPGSTIKPIVALAGLETGVVKAKDKMFAGPFYQVPNDARKYRDWKKAGHGWVDMDLAIAQSSDVYFYDLAYKLGIDRIQPMFSQFGLGRPSGIDLPGESKALLPSRQWKRAKYKKAWYPGETLIVGIGQGYMLSTPLQLARMTGCIALRGDCREPHLLAATVVGTDLGDGADNRGKSHKIDVLNSKHWDTIIKAMENVMTGPTGTARKAAADASYRIAGKSGTSQVFGLKEDEQYDAEKLRKKLHDHALFVSFAPVENPTIAVAVIVEHGGSGSRVAAPIARKVMDAWLLPPAVDPAAEKEEEKEEKEIRNP